MELDLSSVICSGYVLKKCSSKEFLGNSLRSEQYNTRYLILTPVSLRYYHKKPARGQYHKGFVEIMLSNILSVSYYTVSIDNIDEKYQFEVELASSSYKFQVPVRDTADIWVDSILRTRAIYLRLINRSQAMVEDTTISIYKKIWKFGASINTSLSSLTQSKVTKKNPDVPTPLDCLNGEDIYVILRLEYLLVSNAFLLNMLPSRFFSGLKKLPNSSQSTICKQLGTHLAFWLGRDNSNNRDNNDRNANSLPLSILRCWLEFVVQKELESSLGAQDAGIMPFRVDSFNSHIISSFVRTSVQMTSLLSSWLSPLILPMGIVPKKYLEKEVSYLEDFRGENPALARLTRMCVTLFERISTSRDQLQLSPALLELWDVIQSEVIAYSLNKRGKESSTDDLNQSNSKSIEEDSYDKGHKIFRTVLSTLLFLRCICPALMLPIEWGCMKGWSKGFSGKLVRTSLNINPIPFNSSFALGDAGVDGLGLVIQPSSDSVSGSESFMKENKEELIARAGSSSPSNAPSTPIASTSAPSTPSSSMSLSPCISPNGSNGSNGFEQDLKTSTFASTSESEKKPFLSFFGVERGGSHHLKTKMSYSPMSGTMTNNPSSNSPFASMSTSLASSTSRFFASSFQSPSSKVSQSQSQSQSSSTSSETDLGIEGGSRSNNDCMSPHGSVSVDKVVNSLSFGNNSKLNTESNGNANNAGNDYDCSPNVNNTNDTTSTTTASTNNSSHRNLKSKDMKYRPVSYSVHQTSMMSFVNILIDEESVLLDSQGDWYFRYTDDFPLGFPSGVIVLLSHVLHDELDDVISLAAHSSTVASNQCDESKPRTASIRLERLVEIKELMKILMERIPLSTISSWTETISKEMIDLSSSEETELKSSGCLLDADDAKAALREFARMLQKIANIACMDETGQQTFLMNDLARRNKDAVELDEVGNSMKSAAGNLSVLFDSFLFPVK